MVTRPDDEHPMWGRLPGAAADAPEVVCRIALPAAEMRALIGEGAPPPGLVRIAVWDPPETLLADDATLAATLRAAGVHMPDPPSTFAQRQADAHDALQSALHRYQDHGEASQAAAAFEAPVAVVIARGEERVHALLARLIRDAAPAARTGLVVDARDPRAPRVFAIGAVAADRVLLVRAASVEDLPRAHALGAVHTALTGG